MITGKFPNLRLRRSRKYNWSRRLIEENKLTPNDFILPVFIMSGKNKKQIIYWGVAGALIFKIIFALFATYLFKFYFIKILGGLLLIWIVNDLRKDLFEIKKIKPQTKKSKEPSFIQSVYKVLFADIMISFDNVIGVVGAAKGNFSFMIFGLVLSVILTGALATYLASYIQKHLWIAYVGLIFILLVALQLVIGGLVDLDILTINEEFRKYF